MVLRATVHHVGDDMAAGVDLAVMAEQRATLHPQEEEREMNPLVFSSLPPFPCFYSV